MAKFTLLRAVSNMAMTVVTVIALASDVAASNLTQHQAVPYLRPQRLVDVGGHKLNLYCTGRGSPSVILDAGEGETMITWRKVQPQIAKFARVCSFDRAGMGFSTAGPLPRDADAMVADLHTLLQRAGVPRPYVLVAHSAAGLYAPLYAWRYPDAVAGMVLVDPSFPNQDRELDAVSPTMRSNDAKAGDAYVFCYHAAVQKKLDVARGSDAYAVCGFPAHAASDLRTLCAKQGATSCELEKLSFEQFKVPAFWTALGSEDKASGATDSREDLRYQRSLGALPLIVLTAANDIGDDDLPAAEQQGVDRVWTAGHDRLAHRSSVGVDFTVKHSGHFIQLDQPAAVTGAIAEVISLSKNRSH